MTSQQELELLRAVELMAQQNKIMAEKLLQLQTSLMNAKAEIIQLQMELRIIH